MAGRRINIGAGLTAHNHLILGDDIMISSQVSFIGNDHKFDSRHQSIQDQSTNPRAVTTIEGDNLIGYGAIIIGNVTIGYGAIVGAGSVVTKSLESNGVYAGNPAKLLRKRR